MRREVKALIDKLDAAETAPAIIEGVARVVFYKEGKRLPLKDRLACPASMIPTVQDLAEVLPDLEKNDRMFTPSGVGEPTDRIWTSPWGGRDTGRVHLMLEDPHQECVCSPWANVLYLDWEEWQQAFIQEIRIQHGWWALDGGPEGLLGHPIQMLVSRWMQRRGRDIAANRRPDPIAPALLFMTSKDVQAPPTAMYDGGVSAPRWITPALPDAPRLFTPAMPLGLFDLGGGSVGSHRRGAPLALRMFVEAVLAVSPEDRGSGATALPPERWGDFLHRLFPDSAGGWRRSNQWGAALAAFEALDSPDALIPWQNSEGGWQLRRTVSVRDRPATGGREEWVQLVVDLPPGSEHGPIIDRLALRRAGVVSSAAYRLALNLAAWWHRPGATRVPVGGTWRQVRQVGRYPVVTNNILVAMAYPQGAVSTAAQRERLAASKRALKYLVQQGYATSHDCSGGRRILPGPQWAGWGITIDGEATGKPRGTTSRKP